jgi:hypothetical protein
MQSVISAYESGHRQSSLPTLAVLGEAAADYGVSGLRVFGSVAAARTGPTATLTCSLTCRRA